MKQITRLLLCKFDECVAVVFNGGPAVRSKFRPGVLSIRPGLQDGNFFTVGKAADFRGGRAVLLADVQASDVNHSLFGCCSNSSSLCSSPVSCCFHGCGSISSRFLSSGLCSNRLIGGSFGDGCFFSGGCPRLSFHPCLYLGALFPGCFGLSLGFGFCLSFFFIAVGECIDGLLKQIFLFFFGHLLLLFVVSIPSFYLIYFILRVMSTRFERISIDP